MYAVTASVVLSIADAKPMCGAYSRSLAVAAKMCERSVALVEAAEAVAKHIFAMDVVV